jgi:hypothetical protein
MSFVVSAVDFEHVKSGWYNAVCVSVVDLGLQGIEYPDKKTGEKKYFEQAQVALVFELSEKYTTGDFKGKPFVVFEKFSQSIGNGSKLREFIEWWLDKKFPKDSKPSFDLDILRGKSVHLQVATKEAANGKIYTNIVDVERPKDKLEPVNLGYVPKYLKELVEKRLDKQGQQLDIADEFYDDPNKAFADAANADIGAEGGIDYRTLGDDDMPFRAKSSDETIPY